LKHDASEREALTRGERGYFLRAPVQPRIVYSPLARSTSPSAPRRSTSSFPDIDAEAQDQLFHVERVAPQLPRAGTQRLELLRAQRRAGGHQNDRVACEMAESARSARQSVRLSLARRSRPMSSRMASGVWTPRQLEHLLPLGRGHDPIPALRQHALERFGQPLVGVRQQN